MKMTCDFERKRQTLKEKLMLRGWRLYDGVCEDFVSHDNFYGGQLIPVSQALEAEKLVSVTSQNYVEN